MSFSIDAEHLERQREFSTKTFGPGLRTKGVIDHITKEFREIEDDPTVIDEWIDVIILGLDGALRTGVPVQDILDAIQAKQAKNEGRKYPRWQDMPADKAIEHDRRYDKPWGDVRTITVGHEDESINDFIQDVK